MNTKKKGDDFFATHTFERLMTNDEKRLSMLRSFSKRTLSSNFLEGKRILELNATNITYTNHLFDLGIEDYTGLNFNPDVVERLNKQNINKSACFELLKNSINFGSFEDYDLIISFGFLESLSRFELFPFFEKGKDKLHLHSFMNNNREFKNSVKRVFVNGFPMSHDMEYVSAALSPESEWHELSSKNFRDHVIISNFSNH